MKTIAIVQARMGSNRCKGKTLRDILGKPMLWHMVHRTKHSVNIDKVVIATTTQKRDDVIESFCRDNGLSFYRGSEEDVLDRFYQTALQYNADVIVRVTSDCPLMDPKITDSVIEFYLNNPGYDLVRTGHTYAEGLGTEVFPLASLEIAWREARMKSEREHVTPFLWKQPERFTIKALQYPQDLSYLRMTVDEEVDFRVVESIFKHLYKRNKLFHLEDIMRLYKEKPHIFEPNRNAIRNEGYIKTLMEDHQAR